jgi:cytoskeletal protein RodZ
MAWLLDKDQNVKLRGLGTGFIIIVGLVGLLLIGNLAYQAWHFRAAVTAQATAIAADVPRPPATAARTAAPPRTIAGQVPTSPIPAEPVASPAPTTAPSPVLPTATAQPEATATPTAQAQATIQAAQAQATSTSSAARAALTADAQTRATEGAVIDATANAIGQAVTSTSAARQTAIGATASAIIGSVIAPGGTVTLADLPVYAGAQPISGADPAVQRMVDRIENYHPMPDERADVAFYSLPQGATVEGIATFYMNALASKGWISSGLQYIPSPDGTLEQGRVIWYRGDQRLSVTFVTNPALRESTGEVGYLVQRLITTERPATPESGDPE